MPPDKPSPWIRHAALAQSHLLILALLICLAWPRHGGAVLLVRLGKPTPFAPTDLRKIAVLRAGSIPGSLLVRIQGDVPIMALLQKGMLPIGAPDWLCTGAPIVSTPITR